MHTYDTMPSYLLTLQALAQEVAHYLGMELGGITSKRFADGEIYVQIQVRLNPSLVQL